MCCDSILLEPLGLSAESAQSELLPDPPLLMERMEPESLLKHVKLIFFRIFKQSMRELFRLNDPFINNRPISAFLRFAPVTEVVDFIENFTAHFYLSWNLAIKYL